MKLRRIFSSVLSLVGINKGTQKPNLDLKKGAALDEGASDSRTISPDGREYDRTSELPPTRFYERGP